MDMNNSTTFFPVWEKFKIRFAKISAGMVHEREIFFYKSLYMFTCVKNLNHTDFFYIIRKCETSDHRLHIQLSIQ